jgi:hypothetical protein
MPKAEIRTLNGYRLVYEPGHPSSMKSENWEGYIYEHILVAEKFLGRPLTSDEVVHHLDFDRSNNKKENILVLLRSEHGKLHVWINSGAQVCKDSPKNFKGITYGAKNTPSYCAACGRTIHINTLKKYCSIECSHNSSRKVERPSKVELERNILTMSYVAIGKKYGVSDNTIRKWAKSYGII